MTEAGSFEGQSNKWSSPDPDIGRRRRLWQENLPSRVRALFIAESPPREDRYFYYEESASDDHLFMNLMRVLYPELRYVGAKSLRALKPSLLARFKADGYLVIDVVEERLARGIGQRVLRQMIAERQDDLLKRIRRLPNQDFTAITVKATVLDGLSPETRGQIGNVFWGGKIYFPSNGRQSDFSRQMAEALVQTGLRSA